MIEVEFRQPVRGGGETVALTLRVEDDGSYAIDGPLELDLEAVAIADRTLPSGRLWLRDDPARWARNAHKAFRTGYLVPVVVKDDGPSAED